MLEKLTNRSRVARWRTKKVNQGYRALTVYLSPEVLNMVKFLRRHFGTQRKPAELMVIEKSHARTRCIHRNYRFAIKNTQGQGDGSPQK